MQALSTEDERASHRGVYEVSLRPETDIENPYLGYEIKVRFQRPDGSTETVDGFFDGDGTYRARAYCDRIGEWRWEAVVGDGSADASGSFEVTPSNLPGKLRRHPDDPRRLRHDDGEWFLHIGDTGYRYPIDTEPAWKSYIDDAVRQGATKIRTWFAGSRHGVEGLFADERRRSERLNLEVWQEIDRRYQYALETYPHVQLQIIPYAEDGEALRAYEDDSMVQFVGRYAQARFSALPNLYWCIANDVKVIDGAVDREIVEEGARAQEGVSKSTIGAIGRDFADRESWGTLLTSHQRRTTGYDFVDAEWSDLCTLHDLDQGAGARVREYYLKMNCPVILDEDRYERYREPEYPQYFFRRLLWANLLSGGHPTYGGNRTYEPSNGEEQGIRGYTESDLEGMADFNAIHTFFDESNISLVGLSPDNTIADDEPGRIMCCHDNRVYLAYFANPDGYDPKHASPRSDPQSTRLELPSGEFFQRWYDPRSAKWSQTDRGDGGGQEFTTPAGQDWVLVLERAPIVKDI